MTDGVNGDSADREDGLGPGLYQDLGAQAELAELSLREVNSELAISTRLGNQFGRALTTAFIGVAAQGKSLGDVMRSLALKLSGLALNAAFKPLESALGSALQGLVSGSVGAGSTVALGTSGPSLFTAGGSIAAPAGFPLSASSAVAGASRTGLGAATSLANAAAGQPAQGVRPVAPITINVTTPDIESFRRSETQLAAMVARTVGQGQRNL